MPPVSHPCRDCKWFHPFTAKDELYTTLGTSFGECHAHPPVFHHKASWKWENEWAFPVVDGNNPDICSDYKD